MANREKLIVGFVVLFAGLVLTGCATVQAPPELLTAIEEGNIENVKSIIEENPRLVNSQRDWVLRYDFEDTIEGIPTFEQNTSGVSPLYAAVVSNNKDMVKLLLENGADVDSGYGDGTTLYHILCSKISYTKRGTSDDVVWTTLPNAEDMAMLLINSGADVNKKCKVCPSPLQCAIESGWYELAEMLIEKGADVNAKDNKGKTPLDLAIERGHEEIAELLKKHGAVE